MARVTKEGLCRGEGLGFVAVRVEGEPIDHPSATAHTKAGRKVPCAVVPQQGVHSNGAQHLAIVIPLLACDVLITLGEGGSQGSLWETTFSARASKVSSRLLTMRKPQLAAGLRALQGMPYGAAQVGVTDIWPAGDGRCAWRVRAAFATGVADGTPNLTVQDAQGEPVAADIVVMEDHVVPAAGSLERLVTFSALVPEGQRHLCLGASLGETNPQQGFCCLLPYQAEGLLAVSKARVTGPAGDPRYPAWLATHRAGAQELEAQRERATSQQEGLPSFDVVLLAPATEATRRTLEAQTLASWTARATLAEAQADHVIVLQGDEELEPNALYRFAEALRENPQADLLYCDADVCDGNGPAQPLLKPGPDHARLLAQNYVGTPLVVSRVALDALGELPDLTPQALPYELALRGFEVARQVVHVPHVLSHEPARTPDDEAARHAVKASLVRQGVTAAVAPGPLPHTLRVTPELPEPAPSVSIVIPSRDHADLLRTCVTSLLEHTDYPAFDITVVENNSTDPETFACYEELAADPRVRVVTWQPAPGAQPGFNYSALINFGVRSTWGELLCPLNNDTEAIRSDWLREMVCCLARPAVGVVGAKLLYGDGLVQHLGLAANPNGDFYHPDQNLSADEPGYLGEAALPSDRAMVTGACQLMSRALYEELGGYDEELAVGFNDGDFCLRAREAGYLVTCTPYAILRHKEFSSRGREATDARLKERYLREKALFMARHAAFIAAGDPNRNPNLDAFSPWPELGR